MSNFSEFSQLQIHYSVFKNSSVLSKVPRRESRKECFPGMPVKNICCFGAGQSGVPLSAVIATKCPEIRVTVLHTTVKGNLEANQKPFPYASCGLNEILKKCQNKNLFFTSNEQAALKEADLIFIVSQSKLKSYGEGEGKSVDMSSVEEAANTIAECITSNKIVVENSCIPMRTAELVKQVLNNNCKPGIECEVLSNPEFYEEGSAINNLLNPEYVLIGYENTEKGLSAAKELSGIYERWVPSRSVLLKSVWDVELTKIVSIAFAAQKKASVYSLCAICEETKGDVAQVTRCLSNDSSIESKILSQELNEGKFPRTVGNLVYICESLGLMEVAEYWRLVLEMFTFHKDRFFNRILWTLNQITYDRRITIFGFAVYRNSEVGKGSGTVELCKKLLEEKAMLNVFDPKISKEHVVQDLKSEGCKVKDEIYEKHLTVLDDPYKAAFQAQVLVVCTSCTDYALVDFKKIYGEMVKPAYLFDSMNELNHAHLLNVGYRVFCMGKYIKNVA